jgi:hypothetical protein
MVRTFSGSAEPAQIVDLAPCVIMTVLVRPGTELGINAREVAIEDRVRGVGCPSAFAQASASASFAINMSQNGITLRRTPW